MLQSALSLFLACCLLGHLDCTELTVKRGADAILQCSGHNATEIMLIWNKPELQSEGYLLYFRDGQFQEELQHELFKGRVELKDPDWKKTGDFSVILKHVTPNDAGTYECHAGYEGQKSQLLSSFILKVEKPGQTGGQKKDGGNEGEEKEEEGKEHGSVGLIVGVVVAALLLFAAAGLVYFYKRRNTRTQYHAPQRQEEAEMNSDLHQPAPQRQEEAETNSDSHQPAPQRQEEAEMNSDSHQPAPQRQEEADTNV